MGKKQGIGGIWKKYMKLVWLVAERWENDIYWRRSDYFCDL
jgi:hypothetical protein